MRVFLFLQGPHGPFYAGLGDALGRAGCRVLRVGFNRGDEFYWPDKSTYLPFLEEQAAWQSWLSALMDREGVSDVVVYGDTRAVHDIAREEANLRGIALHTFEEGYLRPYWVTYERGGVNGHSRLMQMSVSQMQKMMGPRHPQPEAPAHWGALRQHSIYGAIYHANIVMRNGTYKNYRPHRDISVERETFLNLKRLMLMPLHSAQRKRETARLRRSGEPYHLVLMQLAHDSSFRMHSELPGMVDFVRICCEGFAQGAPKHHRLVFKSHPLEDGREPIHAYIKDAAKRHGISERVHLIHGGKLAPLINKADTAVTVNSTAGQQVLLRGIPLRTFGRAIYSKDEFVSRQPLPEFFSNPMKPDIAAYRDFRQFLLETSQIPGSFYTREGRAQIHDRIVDILLANADPYELKYRETAAAKQHLSSVPIPDLLEGFPASA